MKNEGYTKIYIKYRNIPELNLSKLEEFYKIYDINIKNESTFDGRCLTVAITNLNEPVILHETSRSIISNSGETPEEIKGIIERCDSEIRFIVREMTDNMMVQIFIAYLMKQTDVAVYYEQYLSEEGQQLMEKYSGYTPLYTCGYYTLEQMKNLPDGEVYLKEVMVNIEKIEKEAEKSFAINKIYKVLVMIYAVAMFATMLFFATVDFYGEVIYVLITAVVFVIVWKLLRRGIDKNSQRLSNYMPIYEEDPKLEEAKRKKDDFQI